MSVIWCGVAYLTTIVENNAIKNRIIRKFKQKRKFTTASQCHASHNDSDAAM